MKIKLMNINKYGELVEGKYPIYPYPSASGLWSSSLNLAQLTVELMDVIKGKSKIGVPQRLAKEMITPQLGKSWSGLGVFIENKGELKITSMGWGVGFQAMIVAYPDTQIGAVILTNADLGVHQTEGIIGEICSSLIS
ncbi:hypothetical protein [Metabacillus malikii]|uniref:CubicO group peptidase (Beta-lactamase class C family) n=1 Tax=Metabacillus malikii TaxID=1504265 RepID=A0ABT9ZDQ3_9BACI|nr:hypothetical protein [Metabacillus malikii]MDQ0230145.1 CubicO group peptidase (beta-lactamase class C family) [Metabacillus malikii]